MTSTGHAAFVRRVVLATAALFVVPGCASTADRSLRDAEIRSVLDRQADAWNRGDIDAFMQDYEKSEALTFSSGGQTQRGWKATYDRYKKRYPTPERMGRVTFSELEITLLGAYGDPNAALVLGRWFLQREPDPVGGNFSLVLTRAKGEWRIRHDHTSVDPAAAPR